MKGNTKEKRRRKRKKKRTGERVKERRGTKTTQTWFGKLKLKRQT